MHRLSMASALSIWSDLCDALHGVNGFGGNVAEIYMYRLETYSPLAHGAANMGDMQRREREESTRNANESLLSILAFFAESRDAVIWVDGREIGWWIQEAGFTHRVHVKVEPRKKGTTP